MKTLVLAALLVTALGTPIPDDDDCEYKLVGYSGGASSGYQQAVSYVSAPAVQHYTTTYTAGPLRPVQPTSDVQKATAEFMAAWNKAAARATKIQTVMYKTAPTGGYTIQIPTQVQQTEEVRRATAEFMEAWNAAAQRATVVEQAAFSLPQPVQPTAEVRRATARFMSSWEAAARQASALQVAMTKTAAPYSGPPRPVQPTEEVRQATTQFMAAWREAAARVPSIQPTIYKVAGAVPSTETPRIVGGVPQVTFEVERATADFMKVWRAAAAAAQSAPDVNIIMKGSYQPQLPHPAPVHYSAPAGPPKPVEPTYEVQKATAEFMAAWNKAAARASRIQTVMYKTAPTGAYTIQMPTQVQQTEEVRRATAEFMEAWNAAARRATVVEQAAFSLPQPVQPTAEVRRATAQFMSAWKTAAQRASALRVAMTYSGPQQPVQPTEEVRQATAQFMAAWREAAARVPSIQSTIYKVAGAVPSGEAIRIVDGVPQATFAVEQATTEFMKIWRAAAAAAEAAPDVDIIMGASYMPKPAHVTYAAPARAVTYSAAPSKPVDPTLEVQKATAEFMAAWNKAAARASRIQTVMVKSSPTGAYTIQMPTQVQQTEEVRRATAEFMEAWNAAAQRATVVEQAAFSLPQPVQPTAEVRRATAQFMSAWETAAQQASALRVAMTYSSPQQPVQPTEEVRQATAQFMAAWREAAARVPSIQPMIYKVAGVVPSAEAVRIVDGVPQVTFEVQRATTEFMKVWRAAAAAAEAAPDINVIMGASYQPHSARPAPVTYAVPSVPAPAVTYSAGPLMPVQPTLEVQRATAEFMAAWNTAAKRASQIQATLVKSGGIHAPYQVGETDAVKKATAEFMSAWNAAARRGSVVEQVISTIPEQVDHTDAVKKATAEFMASWQAAAQRASAIRQTVSAATTYAAPQHVQATADVQKATAEFMALWNKAAARVPKIETTLYSLSGSTALEHRGAPVPVSDTPEVRAAKEAFMVKFRAAQAAAARTSVVRGVLPVPSVLPVHHTVYTTSLQPTTYTIDDRIFAPFVGLPLYAKDCD